MIKYITIFLIFVSTSFGAVTFDGTDDYIVSDIDSMLPDYPLSLSCWIKTSTTSTSTVQTVHFHNNSSLYNRIGVAGGAATCAASDGGASTITGTTTINDNEWHFIAATFGSRTSRELFVDGVSEGTSSVDVIYSTFNAIYVIGQESSITPNNYFDGEISDARIYNRALSAQEVLNLFHSTGRQGTNTTVNTGPTSGTTSPYTDTIPDLQGSFDVVKASEPLSIQEDVGFWFTQFDGTDDYLVNSSFTGITNYPFTLSVWINKTISETRTAVSLNDASSSTSYHIISTAGTVARVASRNPDEKSVDSTTAINDGAWHHLVGVFSSATSREVYVDAVSEGSDTNSVSFDSNIDSITISLVRQTSPAGYWTGDIGQVRVYDTNISSTLVTNLFNGGRNAAIDVISTSDLISFYDMKPSISDPLAGRWLPNNASVRTNSSIVVPPGATIVDGAEATDYTINQNHGVVTNSPVTADGIIKTGKGH